MRFARALACLAFVISTTAAAGADFITVPAKQLTKGSPIFITDTSVFVDNNNASTFRACVSFRNVSQKPVNFVVFTFKFDDLLGNAIREGILRRSGSFGPGVNIEGKMSVLGGNSDSFNNCLNLAITSQQPNLFTIDVIEVHFDDGTVWKKGDPMPGTQPTAQPGGGNGNATANVNGATGIGITLGSTGGTFGAIAWLPGSHKIFATSVDQTAQADADYDAQVKCNTLNGGGTACKLVLQLSGTKNRCGAILLDDTVNPAVAGLAQGPNNNDTIKAAAEVLSKKGGNLGANTIVTVVCNTK